MNRYPPNSYIIVSAQLGTPKKALAQLNSFYQLIFLLLLLFLRTVLFTRTMIFLMDSSIL